MRYLSWYLAERYSPNIIPRLPFSVYFSFLNKKLFDYLKSENGRICPRICSVFNGPVRESTDQTVKRAFHFLYSLARFGLLEILSSPQRLRPTSLNPTTSLWPLARKQVALSFETNTIALLRRMSRLLRRFFFRWLNRLQFQELHKERGNGNN